MALWVFNLILTALENKNLLESLCEEQVQYTATRLSKVSQASLPAETLPPPPDF
jgi:hypothetical protein